MKAHEPRIDIPSELRPQDGRFCSGPSKVRAESVDALAAVSGRYLGTSHRQEGVRSVVRRVRHGLTQLFGLPDGYEVVVGVGGASLLFDAVAYGVIERRSQHLVFGEFSSKFAGAARAAPHLEAPDVIESEVGTHPDPRATSGVDTYCLTHNETSTGVAMTISRPSADGLVVVDATSGAGGLRIDARDFDVYFFSPQKCFAADAGIWLALCSPAAIERIEKVTASDRVIPAILDLFDALTNSRKDQTYNTPPLASLFLMGETIDWMLGGGGLEWSASRCDRNAEIVYGWAERSAFARPFVADPTQRSHTIATIDFDDRVDAAALGAVLRDNGILDVEPYRKLARNQLRVALFPAIEAGDVEALTHAVDYVVERLDGSAG